VLPVTVAPPFNQGFSNDDQADGANVLARWEGNFSDGSEFTLQSYYDRVSFSAPFLSDDQDIFDLDFQHRLHPDPSHDLMWGANYRFTHNDSTSTSAVAYTPAELSYHCGSVFVQDDITLIDNRLRLTLGSKLEESYFGHTQVQPNARLLWTPNHSHSLWASVSRASRNPSRGEKQSNIALGTLGPIQARSLPNPDLKAEKVFAAEIGYRTQWTPQFSTDITAFSNHYTDLILFRLGELDFAALTQPVHWFNATPEVTTRGIELASEWQALEWMRFTGNYSHIKIEMPFDPNNPDNAGLSPRHRGALRWQMDLPEHLKLDVTLRHVGKLSAVRQSIPAYTTFDARLAYEPVSGLELSFVAQNLFSPQHTEFHDTAAVSIPGGAAEIPRSLYGKLSWQF